MHVFSVVYLDAIIVVNQRPAGSVSGPRVNNCVAGVVFVFTQQPHSDCSELRTYPVHCC